MTRDDATRLMAQMLTVWPNADLPEATVAYWLELLHHLPLEVGAAAVESCAGSCRFFPSIAEFQQAARVAHTHQKVGGQVALPAPEGDYRELGRTWVARVRETLRGVRA